MSVGMTGPGDGALCLGQLEQLTPGVQLAVAAALFVALIGGGLFWRRGKTFLRFIGGLVLGWLLTLVAYLRLGPAEGYLTWLRFSDASTVMILSAGTGLYLSSLFA
ncbi:MAG: hypothetical protein QGD94_10410, partial [Planctomycetia bacterium]|nr:hypothetical protein [Planctomycetia bacterium]